MFASNKETALKEAVELTKAAIESSSNVPPINHQDKVAGFVEALYRKLAELHAEAEIED
ncbi:hypothetical protein [uncultured Olegusella sp.]|uniref:hypothetical protein n=1 Tax=uncultured Olegusella sp. TaxID=1979846 RepID=UPI00263008E2|nr:hypothetical protein [uncultured Olegusella sp.]